MTIITNPQISRNPYNDTSLTSFGYQAPYGNAAFPKSVGVEEAFKLANLNWEVKKQPMYYDPKDEGMDFNKAPKVHAMVRQDTGEYLGHVGDRYKPFQNRDLIPMLEIIAGVENLKVEAAGTMKGGAFVFLVMERPKTFEPIKGDPINLKLMVSCGHNGEDAIRITSFSQRIICTNMVRLAMSTAKHSISIRHSASMNFQIARAGAILQKGEAVFREHEEMLREMSKVEMSVADWNTLVHTLHPDPEANKDGEVSQRALSIATNKRNLLTELFEGRAIGSEKAGKTLYGAYNVLSEFATHRFGRGESGSSQRFYNNLLGDAKTSAAGFMEEGTAILQQLMVA